MNVFDSPLEALAFNYVTFGFLTVVNNLWTWVAVITAAVSFWRIRAAGSLKSDPHGPVLDRNTVGSQPALALSPCESTEEPAIASASGVVTLVCAVEEQRVTKGKFAVYFEDDREGDGELVVDGDWDDSDGIDGFVCDGWERMMTIRMGDLGWYRFQDTTVLNGNVVRLWDGSRRRSSRLGCVVW